MKICVLVAATLLAFHAGSLAGDAPTAEQSLQRLLDGNKRFAASQMTRTNQTADRRAEIAKGQKPFAIVLSCADSRVAPELVFDQGLGDLFVIRVAGNVVDVATLGSIEYAAEHLGVPLVIVLGHEKCGAVQAAVAGGEAGGHVYAIVQAIEPAVKLARQQGGDLVENAVVANVQRVVKQLELAEPLLTKLRQAGKLKIAGARYDLDTGVVSLVP